MKSEKKIRELSRTNKKQEFPSWTQLKYFPNDLHFNKMQTHETTRTIWAANSTACIHSRLNYSDTRNKFKAGKKQTNKNK